MKKIILILSIATYIIPTITLAVSATGYVPLVGIPGVPDVNTDFNKYINSLYGLSISIAALLAVIKIVIAGVKWMMSDVVTDKGSAKKDIQGALLGLLVILGAVLILQVINPKLLEVNLNLDKQEIKGAPISTTVEDLDTALVELGPNFKYLSSEANEAQTKAFERACKGVFRLRATPSQSRCYDSAPGKGITEINNICDEVTTACDESAMKACEALEGGVGVPDTKIPIPASGKPVKGVICYYSL